MTPVPGNGSSTSRMLYTPDWIWSALNCRMRPCRFLLALWKSSPWRGDKPVHRREYLQSQPNEIEWSYGIVRRRVGTLCALPFPSSFGISPSPSATIVSAPSSSWSSSSSSSGGSPSPTIGAASLTATRSPGSRRRPWRRILPQGIHSNQFPSIAPYSPISCFIKTSPMQRGSRYSFDMHVRTVGEYSSAAH